MYARKAFGVGTFGVIMVTRVEQRALVVLSGKGASMYNLAGCLGYSVRHTERLVKSLELAGLVGRWKGGLISIVGLTDNGKRYTKELRQALTPNELEQLLKPRNKRAARKTNKPNSLGNSLGL